MMCSDLCIGTFAAIWAISQTLIHLWWILLGKSKHACPIEFDVDKQSECQDILSRIIVQLTTDTMAEKPSNATQFKIARDIKLTLPSFSETTSDILMLIYIILDGIWIVTSVSLLLASCCRFKEKSSLYFYMPWVIVGGTLVMFDVYCSVYFGLNIPKSWTLMEWLEMLGIVEQKFDKPKFSDGFGFRAPVLLMTLFTARFVIIWIINFVLVFAIVRIAKRACLKKDDRPIRRNPRNSNNTRANNLSDPSSTEERIRSWQEFYGTLRTNKPNRNNASFIETIASGTDIRCIDLECYDSFKNGCKKPSEINSEQCHECATYIALNSTAQCAHPPDVILAGGGDKHCSTCRSKQQQLELVSEVVSQRTVKPHKQVEFQGTSHPEPWDSLRRTSLKRSPYPARLQRNESHCGSDLSKLESHV